MYSRCFVFNFLKKKVYCGVKWKKKKEMEQGIVEVYKNYVLCSRD